MENSKLFEDKNIEIERKFLIEEKNLPNMSKMNYMDITQGYIYNINENYVFRLRHVLYRTHDGEMLGEEFYQTIKGIGPMRREEYEARIWKSVFSTFWKLCQTNALHKHRYEIPSENKNHTIHLDIYKNELSGLYTAEVEFCNMEDCNNYKPESWFGEEVTEDFRYANVKLAKEGIPK